MKALVRFCLPLLLCAGPTLAQPYEFSHLAALFNYNAFLPLAPHDSLVADKQGIKIYDLSYASPKGGRVTATFYLPRGKGPFPALLFGHWGYGTRTEFFPEAQLFAEAGVAALLVDYPWVRPAPWRRATRDLSDPELDLDIYVQAVVDLRRGLDLLQTRTELDHNRYAYIGHSYGAQWGAILSAVEDRLKAVVLIGGVPTLADIFLGSTDPDYVAFRARTPQEQITKYLEITSPVDAIYYVPHAAPTPLLFQFANFERYFDQASMQRYAAAASPPKTVKWYDTGHELNEVQALLDRSAWLQEQLGFPSLQKVLRRRLK